jgi:2-(1,2-epoxy-1,2-dihydrophenyl)acetyl-CoA isomerase
MADSSQEAVVGLEVLDHVATITLNRPARLNAIDPTLAEALLEHIRVVAADHDIRAVVMRGAGRAFCAGGDLVALRELIDREDSRTARRFLEMGRDVVVALHRMPKPAIAAVNGPAIGAGASLALACDVRIASEEAIFSLPFVRLGLHPDWGATYFLPRIIGEGPATDLILSGRTVDAREAEHLRIVSRVVSVAELFNAAHGLASKLAQFPAEAVMLAKRSIGQSLDTKLEELLELEVRQQLQCVVTSGAKEAIAAFESRARMQ